MSACIATDLDAGCTDFITTFAVRLAPCAGVAAAPASFLLSWCSLRGVSFWNRLVAQACCRMHLFRATRKLLRVRVTNCCAEPTGCVLTCIIGCCYVDDRDKRGSIDTRFDMSS